MGNRVGRARERITNQKTRKKCKQTRTQAKGHSATSTGNKTVFLDLEPSFQDFSVGNFLLQSLSLQIVVFVNVSCIKWLANN